MVQRQGRLDQTGHAGGGHRVTDLGRDSAQDARPALRWREHASQRAKLGSIGRRHPQPMPLDEPDGRRIDPRGVMGPADRAGMTLAARGGEAAAPPVAGQSDALHHGIDPIAGTLGVAQPLEDHDADSLSGNEAVRVDRERPRRARAREHAELAEDEREIDVGLDVDASHQRQVGATFDESPTPQIQGDQRRGAGGIDDEAGTVQVEPIGKPVRLSRW